MKLLLTTWQRVTLAGMFMFAPADIRTKPGVLAMQDIQTKLRLTDEEKEAVGFIELADGRARWADQEYEAEIEFTNAEWHYVLATLEWIGWPVSDNSNTLWEKIEGAESPT